MSAPIPVCSGDYGYTASLPYFKTSLGAGIVRKNVLGGVTLRANPYPKSELFDDNAVSTAEAGMLTFLLRWEEGKQSERDAREWEKQAFRKAVDEFVASGVPDRTGLRVTYLSERGIEDELKAATAADAPLIAASYAVVVIFAAAAILTGDAANNVRVHAARAAVGAAGTILVALSTAAAVGLLALCGVPFVPITAQVLPFLALAVGVNDMFVMVNAGMDSSRARAESTLAERCAVAAEIAGPSVACTSLCNASVFLLGTASELPAARLFCLHAAASIIATGATTFVGALALAVLAERSLSDPTSASLPTSSKMPSDGDDDPGVPMPLTERLLARYFPPVEQPVVREVLLVTALGAAVAAAWSVSRLSLGLDPEDVVPSNSRLAGYFADLRRYFVDVGPPLYVVTRTPFTDAATLEGQRTIEAISSALASSPWIGAPPIDWLSDFTKWFTLEYGPAEMLYDDVSQAYRVPPSKFNDALDKYLATPCGRNEQGGMEICGSAHLLDIQRGNDGSSVALARIATQYRGLGGDVRTWTDGMQAMRSLATVNGTAGTFAYSPYFAFYEQYLTVVEDGAKLTAGALAVVAVVVFLFRCATLISGGWQPVAALRTATFNALGVVLAAALSTLLALGIMVGVGIRLNAISAVNSAVAVGLSVDFVAHTVFEFSTADIPDASPPARARSALVRLGSCTLNGALSTLLGICFLAGASTPIYAVYYFRAFAALVIAGASVGLVIVPAGLSACASLFVK
ncbi:NPC1-like intracellular cholesterol transporter 1 [Pycnococcus provasolii]